MSLKVISHCRLPLQHSCFFSCLRRSKKKCNIAFTLQVIGFGEILQNQWHQTKTGAGDKVNSKETVRVLCPAQGASRQGMTVRSCQLHLYLFCAGKAGTLEILAGSMASLALPTCFSPRQLTSTALHLDTPNPPLAGTIQAGLDKKTYFWAVILKTAIAGVTQDFLSCQHSKITLYFTWIND